MTLDDLIALNDEIAALARAGSPVGEGLVQAGRDLPHRLGELADRIGDRMQAGQSLEQALRSEESVPPLYLAVVTAGIRSGQLTTAVEGLATTLRRLAEIRTVVSSAMLYPVLVATLATVLFAIIIPRTAQPLATTLQSFGGDEGGWLDWWLNIVITYGVWILVAPLLLLAACFVWRVMTRRATIARMQTSAQAFAWVPGAATILRNGQLATFAEVLGLLVRHSVPLPEAIVLAGEAADGRDLRHDAVTLSDRIRSGRIDGWRGRPGTGIPPLIGWLVQGRLSAGDLAHSLQSIADRYTRRTQIDGEWLRATFPSLATLVLAGTATVLYAAAYFIPWLGVLYRIAMSV